MSSYAAYRITNLEAEIIQLRGRVRHLEDQRDRLQARCTELVYEVRTLKEGIVLPGFTCPSCRRFTGDEKVRHARCRSCDAPRPV